MAERVEPTSALPLIAGRVVFEGDDLPGGAAFTAPLPASTTIAQMPNARRIRRRGEGGVIPPFSALATASGAPIKRWERSYGDITHFGSKVSVSFVKIETCSTLLRRAGDAWALSGGNRGRDAESRRDDAYCLVRRKRAARGVRKTQAIT